jgi:hypothetical protein
LVVPTVPAETRQLIRRFSRDNPLWGAPRIHGELLKLGIRRQFLPNALADHLPLD